MQQILVCCAVGTEESRFTVGNRNLNCFVLFGSGLALYAALTQ